MKRWRDTIIVVALFVALLAYVLLVERKREPSPSVSEATPTPTPLPLLNLMVDDIQAVEIGDGSRTLRLEQRADGWQIGGEQSTLADSNTVFIAVNALTQLSAGRILLERVDDGTQYGLTPPRLSLEITLRSGGYRRLGIGKQTIDGMWYYVQMENDPRLYLVRQYVLQPFFNWLDKPPYPPGMSG